MFRHLIYLFIALVVSTNSFASEEPQIEDYLEHAVFHNKRELVRQLLDDGDQPNRRSGDAGVPLIRIAYERGYYGIVVEFLNSAGLDPEIVVDEPYGITVFHLLAATGAAAEITSHLRGAFADHYRTLQTRSGYDSLFIAHVSQASIQRGVLSTAILEANNLSCLADFLSVYYEFNSIYSALREIRSTIEVLEDAVRRFLRSPSPGLNRMDLHPIGYPDVSGPGDDSLVS